MVATLKGKTMPKKIRVEAQSDVFSDIFEVLENNKPEELDAIRKTLDDMYNTGASEEDLTDALLKIVQEHIRSLSVALSSVIFHEPLAGIGQRLFDDLYEAVSSAPHKVFEAFTRRYWSPGMTSEE